MTRESGDQSHELTTAELDVVSGGAIRSLWRPTDTNVRNFGAINQAILHIAEQQLDIAGRERRNLGGFSL